MIPQFIKNPNPEIYRSNNYVVLDFETTNYNKGSAREGRNSIILSVFGNISDVYRYKFSSEYGLDKLVERISRADFLIAHHAKFELQWLARCGLDLSKVLVYDTLIGQYVIDGNRKSDKSLDGVAKRYGLGQKDSFVSKLIKAGVCPSEISPKYLKKYCVQDVNLTEQIFLKQREELIKNNLLATQYTRCIFTPVLADIEMNGMHLDKDRVEETFIKYNKELLEVEEKLYKITGGINMRSPQQVAGFIYGELGFSECKDRKGNYIRGKPNKRFPEGSPKTDVSTIAALRATNNTQKKFIVLKQKQSKLSKAVSTYLTLFKEVCENNDGILKGQFNQTVTGTHRLSSSRPNFQNFDRGFKGLFSARNNGWCIGERDAAQLEFRVAAFLGRDSTATDDIISGFDVHANTSRILSEAGQCTNRQEAKAHTFKPLFGGTTGTKPEQTYYEAFKRRYSEVARTQLGWAHTVLRDKKLVTCTGLIFYFPTTYITRTGYITNTSNIYNYPVQSLATADIIPIFVTYLWHYMKEAKLESFLVNTIHDSVITEEQENETEIINKMADQAFTVDVINYLDKVYNIQFNIPLELEHKVGTHWGE
jgi:DNA polymerase I-like protein with 3'-5' exonuclease and polymerase domains